MSDKPTDGRVFLYRWCIEEKKLKGKGENPKDLFFLFVALTKKERKEKEIKKNKSRKMRENSFLFSSIFFLLYREGKRERERDR